MNLTLHRRAAVAAAIALTTCLSHAQLAPSATSPTKGVTASRAAADVWTGTWSAPVLDQTLTDGSGALIPLSQMTLRQSFRTSIGGTKIRVRLSNLFGQQPITLRDLHFAKAASDQAIVTSTDKVLTFKGSSSVTIPAGQEVSSDAVAYTTTPSTDYAVSMYVFSAPDSNHVTAHRQAWQNIYQAAGDVSGSAQIAVQGSPIQSYVFLTGLDVVNSSATGAIVAIGASITDGSITSFGANRRWVNELSLRLQAAKLNVAVLGAGLSGGHLLDDQPFGGPAGVNRFKRDVLSQAGVKWVISSDMPINDLSGHSDGQGHPDGGGPTAAQLIAGTKQMIDQAHAAGVKFLCSTLTPNGGRDPNQWTAAAESIRQQLNAFYLSSSSGCDGIVDQDTATRDPANPLQYRPSFNAGDFLHPNDAGTQAIANAINLKSFEPNGLPPITASTSCGRLLPGQGMKRDQPLTSCDGRFTLYLQDDSNLVLYFGQSPIWAANTGGLNAIEFAFLPDGNAVLYDSTGKSVFETHTAGLQSTALWVQNDGNVVVYDGPDGGPNRPLYATGTCCH
jgi:lysophospholipase L1-like esterase